MSTKLNKQYSSFYSNEFKHNITSLVFSLAIFIASVIVIIHTIVTNGSFLLYILSSMGIIFSGIKMTRQLLLTKNLQSMFETFDENRADIYIFISWNEKKAATPLVAMFFSIVSMIIIGIYGIGQGLGNEIIAPEAGVLGTWTIFLATMIVIWISSVYNYQKLTNLIEAHKEYIDYQEIKIEVEEKTNLAKQGYMKSIIYFFVFPTGILLIPNIKVKIDNYIAKK